MSKNSEKFCNIPHLEILFLFQRSSGEGVVKGFERYNLLRIAEVSSTVAYVLFTIAASYASESFQIVAYIYLASLILRALAVLVAAHFALKTKGIRFSTWSVEIRRDLWQRCMLLLQGKLIGGIAGARAILRCWLAVRPTGGGAPMMPLVRLPRVSKVVVGLLTSALLPVASRLDERGSSTTFQRLGEVWGLIMLPMFTVPPLLAAAVLSHEIMQIWIGPLLSPYASWMGLSFMVPVCAQYLAFGSVIFLTRPEIQFRLNVLLGCQLIIWVAVSFATLNMFAERALILGQITGSLAVLPWQVGILVRALNLNTQGFRRAFGTQTALFIIGSVLLSILADYIQFDSVLKLLLVAGAFCLITWMVQYFLVLENKHRAIFPEISEVVGLSGKQLVDR